MRYLLFFLPLCIFFSCQEKEVNVPENILSEEEMVGLLQEIYLTEAKISKLSLPFDSSKVLYDFVEKDLFERYGVQDSVYETSLNWYYEHPDKLLSVYETLVDSLMVLEKRYGEVGAVKDIKNTNR